MKTSPPFFKSASKNSSARQQAEHLASPLPPLLAEAEKVAESLFQGMHGRRRAGQGETFWDYRPYRPEDKPSVIDWRRSARSDTLHVRENEWEAAENIWMWRDGRAGMAWCSSPHLPSKKERASVVLLALGIVLSRGGERLGVLGERTHTGKAAPEALAHAFDTNREEGDTLKSLLEASPSSKRAHLVIASDGYDPLHFWEKALSRLAGPDIRGIFLHITDPAEENFPFRGRLRFEAMNGQDSCILGRAEKIREAYRQRFRDHRTALKKLVQGLGWFYFPHRTDAPVAQALARLYAYFEEKSLKTDPSPFMDNQHKDRDVPQDQKEGPL